jgi:hypothetical protein
VRLRASSAPSVSLLPVQPLGIALTWACPLAVLASRGRQCGCPLWSHSVVFPFLSSPCISAAILQAFFRMIYGNKFLVLIFFGMIRISKNCRVVPFDAINSHVILMSECRLLICGCLSRLSTYQSRINISYRANFFSVCCQWIRFACFDGDVVAFLRAILTTWRDSVDAILCVIRTIWRGAFGRFMR